MNRVMVALTEGAAEEQDVDEKMDEKQAVEQRSAGVVRKPFQPTPEERPPHEGRACRFATDVAAASRAGRPTHITCS